jgi:hypothetical protein
MGLFDIFSTSFLITIAITMLALCLMFLYFSQKLSEQDHKISSMVDLVTTMAQEIHLLKNTSHTNEVHYPSDLTNNVAPTLVTKHNELIEVSDDDESLVSASLDSDSNASLASLEDELDDSDSELDDESLASLEESELNDVNSLNIDEDEHVELEHLEDIDYIQNVNNNVEEDKDKEEEVKEQSLGDLSDLKTISMSDSNNHDTDYKKMSVDKLRHVVVEKGLVVDASKLKKKDLLKLLGLSE